MKAMRGIYAKVNNSNQASFKLKSEPSQSSALKRSGFQVYDFKNKVKI